MDNTIIIGDAVEVVGHYQWCGADVHGETGTVVAIEEYPVGIVDGGALYMVRRSGLVPMPMLGRDLVKRVSA